MPVRSEHKNVLSWADDLDDATIRQAENSASLPFVAGPVALMPDAHLGFGATIGSVIPTKGAVIPSAVGVDLGCGVIGVETTLTSRALPDDLNALHGRLTSAIPAGMGKSHDYGITESHARHYSQLPVREFEWTDKQDTTAVRQFGTLGGGNHFVEVCLDERDVVWVVLHSGSRGIGNQLATQHIDGAKGLMKKMFIQLPDPDLAYLVEGTPEFDAYISAMTWAQDYALGSREVMMDAALGCLAKTMDVDDPNDLEKRRINCHHNFTALEHTSRGNVWITRKGAIRAREGDLGIVPGSMGTSTFIVSGLGNPASYQSCSHGAGRTMSRSKARKTLDLDTFKLSMAGRAWDEGDASELLDEDPRAYKDVDRVMANQADLVEIKHRLHSVLNMKGVK